MSAAHWPAKYARRSPSCLSGARRATASGVPIILERDLTFSKSGCQLGRRSWRLSVFIIVANAILIVLTLSRRPYWLLGNQMVEMPIVGGLTDFHHEHAVVRKVWVLVCGCPKPVQAGHQGAANLQ